MLQKQNEVIQSDLSVVWTRLSLSRNFSWAIQGAKYYNPDIKIVYNYVGDWGDPDKGRTQALAQFNDSGVEVIFACAGGSGNGRSPGCK